jgi:signal transduction histidine kinase
VTTKRHTILVVDDEADVVKSVKDLLRLEYKVLTATSAAEAQEILRTEEVHIVMTDQRMPDMTGVELLSNIRGSYPHAIRLLFTGYADIRAVIDAINQGNVYRYITKPWDPDELQTVIREACERYDLIVERESMMAELKEKNEELTKADQLKQAFMKVASHELRTPLTILLGLSKLALREQQVPDHVHRFLERMDHAAQRLRQMVEQIVNLLASQQFEEVLERRPVVVDDLLTQAVDDVRPFLELRHQHVDISAPANLGTMNVDREKIRDSINHLLLNAIKFTPDEGRMAISAWREDSKLHIKVSDSGRGIDPEAMKKLFDPFFTEFDVSTHCSGNYEHGRRGLGLGLSVVKAFTELHGGSVAVESELGKGSHFTVTIPDAS